MNLFDIKNKIDNSLYDVFNIISDFLYYFKFSTEKYVKKNERFLNKHLDSRCFIVGTGPSINLLKNEEINLLKNEHIFAVNSYFKIK